MNGNTSALKSVDISPKDMTYTTEGKTRIVLDSAERLDLQRYILEGMALPTTDKAVKSAFSIPDDKLSEFKDMITAFKAIQEHCGTFYNGAYTESVSLASAIVEFNFAAQYYLRGIEKIADDYNNKRVTAEYAEQACTALIDILLKKFNEYVAKCDTVFAGITTFLTQTNADNTTMNGQDGKSGLNKQYRDKYGLHTDEIKKLQDDISEAQRELTYATEKYNHDVVVAATSPTYVWVVPFGTIAAGIVAGIYGKRATDAYKKMGELRTEISSSTGALQQKMAMSACLFSATISIGRIADLIKKAITPIEKMKGSWLALSDDMKALRKTVTDDIQQLPMVVKAMGVDSALAQWKAVADEADNYRKIAFISATSKNLVEANGLAFPLARSA
jgi:hypothetical protein